MSVGSNREILRMEHIFKTYGETIALYDVGFDLRPGEVHCLVGENGAGKSTLIKILAGAEKPESGQLCLFGNKYNYLTPNQSMKMGIATIYQDIELINSLNIVDNIFLGKEIRTKYGTIDHHQQTIKAKELMESLNIDLPVRALVEDLSPVEQQVLQIIKALYIDVKIMVMDEPTASLGLEETKALIDLIRKLTAKGISVIYISHYLEEVFKIGDRITVLKDGEVVNTFEAKSTDTEVITSSMIGRKKSLFYKREFIPSGEVVLQVKNLSKDNLFHNVKFELKEGEILGFGGIVGAGRTELMNVLFGAYKQDRGKVILNGEIINPESPWKAIKNGIAMIPEDRKKLGLLTLRSLLENIAIIHNQGRPLLDHKDEKENVKKMIEQLNITTSGINQLVGYLSGGNQQKAVIARWLLSKAQIFIFDEPTKGVDIGAKEQIYKLMISLVKRGKSIIMVSSDMPELMSMSDRIAIMREGKLVKILDSDQVSERNLLDYFLGVKK